MSSSERNDLPPSYHQALQMDENANTSLSHKLISESIFNTYVTSMNLTFKWDSGNSDNYSFIIRDTDGGYLQAKGIVSNLDITLKGIDGTEILKILKSSNGLESLYIYQFQVHHNDISIGSVTFERDDTVENCLQISTKNDDLQIIVKSMKLGHFSIYRANSSTVPICNIHLPNDTHECIEFNGTIMFERRITMLEQRLCTSAAIAFKVSTRRINRMSRRDASRDDRSVETSNTIADTGDKRCGYSVVLSVVGFIFLIYYFIFGPDNMRVPL